MSNKFHRGERLKSRKEIGRLFSKSSRSVNAYPLRLVFAETEERRSDFPFQAAFVVPKRRFKKAVDRNLIKRRVREAYRIKKKGLLTEWAQLGAAGTDVTALTQVLGKEQVAMPQYALMFIYTGKEAMPYRYIERKMDKALAQLMIKLAKGKEGA